MYRLGVIFLRNRDKLLVGCIYKSLSSSDENHDKLNELLLHVSKLEDSYTHVLLADDYNFPDIDWNSWTTLG
jgi:methenyltetrahydromethanopterin cyclohydrolase